MASCGPSTDSPPSTARPPGHGPTATGTARCGCPMVDLAALVGRGDWIWPGYRPNGPRPVESNTDETYCCWSNSTASAARVKGPPLRRFSAPIAALYQTYTRGRITCGWDVWQGQPLARRSSLCASVSSLPPGQGGIIVGTGRPGRWSLQWGDEPPRQVSTEHHHLDLVLPLAREPVALRLSPC